MTTLLTIDNSHEFTVRFMRFEVHQTVDETMSVGSPMQWAHLYAELEMVADEFLADWAAKPSRKYDLMVEQSGENGSFKTLSFKESVCIEFVEMFDDGSDARRDGAQNFLTCLTITAGTVEVKEAKLENF